MKNKPLIIGFGHKRQRGKDTACSLLTTFNAHLPYHFIVHHFADSMKEGIGKRVFGLSHEQLYGLEKETVDSYWNLTPREILQIAGTNAMRNIFGPDIWVKSLFRNINNQHSIDGGNVHLIADVRFKNEADAIRDAGGYLIRIDRPDMEYKQGIDTHQSEVDLDSYCNWDMVVNNDGTLNKFTGYIKYKLLDIALNWRKEFYGEER